MTHPSVNGIVERLEPCPFCGPGNSIVECYQDDYGYWKVGCGACGSHSGIRPKSDPDGRAKVVARWNTRPAATIISELQAENGRLQRALMFWMPGVDLRLDEVTREQCANDAGLLAGYSGPLAGRRWGNEIIDTVAGLQAMLEESRTEARLMRENWSEAEDRALAAESSLSRIKAETIEEVITAVEQNAFQIMLDVVNEWHRQVGIDDVMKSKLTQKRADTVATGVFKRSIASAIRSLGSTGGDKAVAG